MTKTNGRSMVGMALLLGACATSVPEPEEPVEVTVAAQSSPEGSPPSAEVAMPRRTTTPEEPPAAPTAEVAGGVLPPGLLPQPTSPPPGAPVTTATPVGHQSPPPAIVSAMIVAAGGTNVSGMQPLGIPEVAQFSQGQLLVVPFNINPGKCLTVIGVGAAGITELDLQLTLSMPIPGVAPVVLAQDNNTGPNATIGGGGNCFKSPLPMAMPAVVVMKATQGSGIGAVQIFEK